MSEFAAVAAAWPTLRVAPDRFAAYLAERELFTNASCLGDLYLACACLDGDPEAVALFDGAYLSNLAEALVRAGMPEAIGREAQGALRESLFYATGPDARPKLASYRGRGSLETWIRVVAMRTSLNLMRRYKHEVSLPSSIEDTIAAEADDPELLYLKRLYRDEFNVAFEDALRLLSSRERNILRHALVHELGVDEIGVIYRVGRSTAARWIEAARTKLCSELHQLLISRLKTDQADLSSILRLIRSQLDVNLRRSRTEQEE